MPVAHCKIIFEVIREEGRLVLPLRILIMEDEEIKRSYSFEIPLGRNEPDDKMLDRISAFFDKLASTKVGSDIKNAQSWMILPSNIKSNINDLIMRWVEQEIQKLLFATQ